MNPAILKRILAVVALVCVTSLALAQEQKQKVAIYVIADSNGTIEVVEAAMLDAMNHSSEYIPMERTRLFLDLLDVELNQGKSEEEEIAQAARQMGASLVCVVCVGTTMGESYMTGRLIDVETACIERTAAPIFFVRKDILSACAQLTTQLLTQERGARTIQEAFGK